MIAEHKKGDAARNDLSDRSSAAASPWQFSLRSLFAVTTIASGVLAVGVYFAGIMFAVSIVVVIQVAVMLASDWLIRPTNRRALAFVTAGSWIILGSGLFVIAVQQAITILASPRLDMMWASVVFLSGFALVCYLLGWHRWRQLSARIESSG